MTERERLIELLDIIIQPGEKTLGDIADYLLANNVVALPCKVGTRLYRITHPCSVCGDWLSASDEYLVKGNYCPNCGAKMENKE